MENRASKRHPQACGTRRVDVRWRKEAKKTPRAAADAGGGGGGGGAPSRLKKKQHYAHESGKADALRAALANAFFNTTMRDDSDVAAMDKYGMGSPTDRIQFGYAPAVAAEAIAFHATIPAKTWIADRRRQFRAAIVKKRKLTRPNCEPITSVLKLRHHWRCAAKFVAEVRGQGDAVTQDAADDFLGMLISRQRLA